MFTKLTHYSLLITHSVPNDYDVIYAAMHESAHYGLPITDYTTRITQPIHLLHHER
jgi:hypothetical protein